MSAKDMFFLPNGQPTQNESVYRQAWRDLTTKVLHFFPSFYIAGYDPDVQFNHVDSDKNFNLPVEAALNLAVLYDKLNTLHHVSQDEVPSWSE